MLRSLTATPTKNDFLDRTYRKGKSECSKSAAKASLIVLERYCKAEYGKDSSEIIEELKSSKGDEKYHFLQNFIHFMDKKNLKPRSIRTYFSWSKSFLRNQGIRTYNEDIKALVKFPTEIKESPKPLTLEIIRKILDNSSEQRKGLYLTLLSSGMRLGEALALRKRDFDLESIPVKITIPGKFTKRRVTRDTFISSEAKEILVRRLKRLKEDDLVFSDTKNIRQAVNNEDRVFSRLRKRCGLTQKYSDGKRNVVNIHSMRAWFSTKASKVHGEEYAHALDGHSGYLPQYYRITIEERTEMYQQLEPDLLIYKIPNVNPKQVQELQKKINELEQKNEEIKLLQRDFVKDDVISNLSDQIIQLTVQVNNLKKKGESK